MASGFLNVAFEMENDKCLYYMRLGCTGKCPVWRGMGAGCRMVGYGCGVGMGGGWGGGAGQLFHSCLVTFKTLSSLRLFRSAGRRLDEKAL